MRTGTLATDDSENEIQGTLINGPAWQAGILDGALGVDGADDRVSIPGQPLNGLNDNALWSARQRRRAVARGCGSARVTDARFQPIRGVVLHGQSGRHSLRRTVAAILHHRHRRIRD
jgi:hypothetical protein